MKCPCGYELVRTVEHGDQLIRVRNPICSMKGGRVRLTLKCPDCNKKTTFDPSQNRPQPALVVTAQPNGGTA